MHVDEDLDLLEVLVRAGPERERCCSLLDGPVDDAALILASIVAAGIRARDRVSIDALARLAAVIRALDACCEQRIDRDELRDGLLAQAHASNWFERLGPARALVRTVAELLEDRHFEPQRVTSQLTLLRSQLVETFTDQVVAPPRSSTAATERDATPGCCDALGTLLLEQLDELAETWGMPESLTLARASWARGWITVPVLADLFGDEESELDALLDALVAAGARHLVRTTLAVPSRYLVVGGHLRIGSGLRRSAAYPADARGVRTAVTGTRGRCCFTTPDVGLLVVEREEHLVIAGPPELVARICGAPVPQAYAEFRHGVEQLALADADPPAHLLDAARRFGHGRRRGSAIDR